MRSRSSIMLFLGLILLTVFLITPVSAQTAIANINASLPASISVQVNTSTLLKNFVLTRGVENQAPGGISVNVSSDFIPVSLSVYGTNDGKLRNFERGASLTMPIQLGLTRKNVTGTLSLLSANMVLNGAGFNSTVYDVYQTVGDKTVDPYAGNFSGTLTFSVEPS